MKWLLICLVACSREAPPRADLDLTREHDTAGTYAGVGFTIVMELDATMQSPVFVMLHGRGDTAKQFRDAWPAFPVKLQLSFAQAPLPFGKGRQWFEWQPGTSDDEYADAVGAAEAKLWPAITELANGRTLLVGGFSQGAAVAYAMAVRHPEVSGAFLIGGRIPVKLHADRAAPIVALHGTADDRISIEVARNGIAAVKAAGLDVTLYEYPGVGHTISPAMFEQLAESVRARLTSPPSRSR